MPRTAITPLEITIAGVAPTFAPADNGNGMSFVNDGNTLLEVKNTGGGACTVTLTTPGKVGGIDIVDPTVIVPITTGDRIIGPFQPDIFNQAGGIVFVDFSTGTGVTVAVYHIP